MNFNVAMLNSVNGGFKKGEMNVISCTRTSPISMAYIDSKYGHIVYKFLTDSPSYNLKYDNYEIDIDYTSNEFDRGYILKAALYRRDEIIAFKNYECNDLRTGLIEICEKLIEKHVIKVL